MIFALMLSRTQCIVAILAATATIGGCYYPAKIQPPPPSATRTALKTPYDLAWDAVHSVIRKNDYNVLGDDPNAGIVEAEARSFSVADADCGEMRSVGSKYIAEPDPGGSAVYNFKVEPSGPEATVVGVTATYSTPLHVPLHPISNFQCVSRGTQEARLLKQIDDTALTERRPTASFDKPKPHLTPGRPTLLRPDFFKKPGASNER